MNMNVLAANYQNISDVAKRDLKKVEKKDTSRTEDFEDKGSISKTNESKLSSKAQDYLKKLRKQYGDYDFFVGNSTDDLKSLVKSGSREFTVVFSNAELERMAKDEEYARERLHSVEGAVRMSEEINKKYGFERAFGKNKGTDTEITRIGIVFNNDGTTTLFAELEKSSAKQRELMEKAREERETEKELKTYSKNKADNKKAFVQANSMQELLEKISSVDWDIIKAEKMPETGNKYDFSI